MSCVGKSPPESFSPSSLRSSYEKLSVFCHRIKFVSTCYCNSGYIFFSMTLQLCGVALNVIFHTPQFHYLHSDTLFSNSLFSNVQRFSAFQVLNVPTPQHNILLQIQQCIMFTKMTSAENAEKYNAVLCSCDNRFCK